MTATDEHASSAIVAEGLVKRFGDTTAMAGVDLEVPAGTVFGLLGPNGAGKTTTVRVLATLVTADAGTALVGGYDIRRDAHRVRRLIGLTGQYASVDEMLTGTENLVMIGRLLGLSRADAKSRARELLAEFDLTDAGGRPAKTFSGGMRRRLDLAASLVGRPRLLFLDEPTTGLDPRSRNGMWDVVRNLVSQHGVTVLLTTQYLEEADVLADDIAVVDHGRIIAHGSPEALKKQTGAQTLAVRPANAEDTPLVVATVADILGASPDVAGNLISARVTDPAVLPAVVRRLDDAGVTVGEITLRSSSLDEVFLALTGRPATDETASTPDADGDPAAAEPAARIPAATRS
ncbi:ATP-binding cassette domain-containing protein [Frankia sp. AgB32]|uniref:ATP-binding cassette domain-containing protein n=1 Tax=Frankia sp. AgB32 TaxID=631119 RepID=UPI0034D4CBB5